MKRYRIRLADETFEVDVLDDPRQPQVRVQVDGELFTVNVEDVAESQALPERGSVPAAAAAPVVSAAAANVVTAPLPGTVKSVAAHPGVQVAVGDELLVIEAMKMDNVIRAPVAGRIKAVHAAEGHQVAHGEPLIEFET